MIATAYLIVGREMFAGRTRRVWLKSVRQNRPALGANEAMLKLTLDLPDDVFDAPLVTVAVERGQIAVAAAVEEVVDDGST